MKRFAIDVGGTFTDLVALDDEKKDISITKVPTTPQDPSKGLLKSIKDRNLYVSKYQLFVHGTTIGLNAYLEQRGADVALITTKGFRDIYEIGRTNRVEAYNLKYKKPEKIVPRCNIYTVPERIDSQGNIIEKLDEKEVRKILEYINKKGIKSVAVCFLHSYANPAHEERVHKIIKELTPEKYVSLSSRIIQEYGEFERTSAVVLDAYIKPLITGYIKYIENSLQEQGFKGDFMVQRSGGGVFPASFAPEKPVETIFSGPAGGVMGGLYLSNNTDLHNSVYGNYHS